MELTGKVVLVTEAQQGIAETGKRLWVGRLGFLAAVGDSEENGTEQRLKGRKPLGVGFRQSST